MTDTRCEPPEGNRQPKHAHWLRARDTISVAVWTGTGWRFPEFAQERHPQWVAEAGATYEAPVATPAEFEALRGERDAALERERQAMSASAKARTDLWLVTEERDGLRAGTDRLLAERNALRGEVEALREALDFYACADHYPVHGAEAPDVVRNDGGTKARAALAKEAGDADAT